MKKQILLLSLSLSAIASAETISYGQWTCDVDKSTAAVTLQWHGQDILSKSIARWSNGTDTISAASCHAIKIYRKKAESLLGPAMIITITGKAADKSTMNLVYTLAEAKPEILVQLSLSGKQAEQGVNYIAPVSTTAPIPLGGKDFRQLSVPYDNDAWVRYQLTEFGNPARQSYEVGAVFDFDTRHGIIAGSIDHDLWKSAVSYNTAAPDILTDMTVYCGSTSELTRDVRSHGSVKGKRVESPRFFITLTDDWRDGLEAFADYTNSAAPNLMKAEARPFGWNSWGDLQTKVNFQNSCEVSDFIKNNLQSSFHGSDGKVVVDLDAFWDFGLNEAQHHEFVAKCRRNGQTPGIYYCPFTDWGKNQDATVAEAPQYNMGELYLRHNGNPIEFDGAPALDPTHPGTRARIAKQLNQFKDWGYEYVKIDFMAHGAYESDTHYDPAITTGTAAFNSGMEFIDSVADGKMWINLSIAPLFPTRYAHSRRIGCDAWSNIGSTEYTLNALTYGWWLDHLYHYNDADHIVFKGVSEGENRARLLSSAITGVYFLGDDMSATGDSLTLERIRHLATNDKINDMARRTKSFRPVFPGNGEGAARIFEGRDGNTLWVAIFNFTDEAETTILPYEALKIEPDHIASITELWSNSQLNPDKKLTTTVQPKDAVVYQIELN